MVQRLFIMVEEAMSSHSDVTLLVGHIVYKWQIDRFFRSAEVFKHPASLSTRSIDCDMTFSVI